MTNRNRTKINSALNNNALVILRAYHVTSQETLKPRSCFSIHRIL